MALDFPSSPTNGQVYNNWTYNSTKGVWQASPLDQQQASVSSTAPLNPAQGDMWFNTNDGNLYVYYNDGDTSQWVQTRSDVSLSSTLGPNVDSLVLRSPNYIINGAFDIWQRGTTFTTTAAFAYTADRWNANVGTGATIVTSQQTFTPGAAPVAGYEGTYFCRVNRSTTGSASSYFTQRIEDVRTLANQTATVSFWAKASATYTFGAGEIYFYQNFGSGGSASVGTSINAGTTTTITTSWQRFSYTVTLPSISGKTVGSSSYLELAFSFPTSSGTFTLDLWGMQVEGGSIANAFRRNAPSIQAELATCQRYYFRKYPDNVYGIFGMGFVHGGAYFITPIQLPVPMRAIPSTTLDWTGTAANYRTMPGGSANALTSSPYIENGSAYSPSASMVGVTAPITATTSGLGGVLQANNTTSAYLGFSAEL